MAGASIKGIQSQHVVSSIKHFALNTQETQRHSLNATMSEVALRESDLMAFEIAMEKGQPGAVMCAYNMVNDKHGCSNDWLLNQVLRREWGFRGWVMSDWGATTGPSDIVAGLDQESGAQLDAQVWFDTPLKRQIADGNIDGALVGQSVRRILRSLIAVGADRKVQEGPIDYDAHAQVARQVAEEGIVLLKNDGVLPLADTKQRILVVGRFADAGVWSGGGSSQVIPVGGVAERMRLGGSPFLGVNGFQVIMPSSPLDALRKALPQADIIFDAGYTPETAAAKAARSDIVIVFANKWQVESLDAASLSLPEGQNDLIAQVTRANPNAIIVLETGNPVSMPWLGNVRAVVQAWYSGQQGAAAIADILSGRTNPSGHLPMTFPRIESQAPRSTPPGLDLDDGASLQVDYVEGSDVGYRWYARRNSKPLFAFGYGLSYTTFHHGALHQDIGRPLTFNVTSKNVGRRDGADVLQLYLVSRNGIRMRRLVGFQRLALKAGEEKSAQISIESRLLSDWTDGRWQLPEGRYRFAIGRSASDLEKSVEVRLATGLADSFKILP
jgi:beta-glucosidase